MPDLLIYCPDHELNGELQDMAEAAGIRAKVSVDVKTMFEWLTVRSFDLMFLHSSLSIPQQQDLAGLLWKKNLAALLYVFDLDKEALQLPEVRLLGAEVVKGGRALERLEQALRNFQNSRPLANPDFQILVVEDLEAPRDIICMFIEGLGFSQVKGCSSAYEALDCLQREPLQYSCVVTDIRMPKVSGKQLIEVIRADPRLKHLPVIVLTAFGTVDCLVDCLQAGASGFLVKPPKKKDISLELARAKRIIQHGLSPRLVGVEDIDALRDVLFEKGFC